jgi:hypothetical protein
LELLSVRTKLALFALSGLPLITACSFLLDFDSLQGGKKPVIDAGADSGSTRGVDDGGTVGDSGTAGESGATSESASDACAGASCDNREREREREIHHRAAESAENAKSAVGPNAALKKRSRRGELIWGVHSLRRVPSTKTLVRRRARFQ